MVWKVSELAQLAKVTARTLHHYDEIGLLKPSERSEAGYRLYGIKDLERLQQIRFFCELGFCLEEIHRIMTDPFFDRQTALLAQRELLIEKTRRIGQMIEAVDRALLAQKEGIPMNEKKMFEGFDSKQYQDEVKKRWGETEAFQESKRRTKKYGKADWQKISSEVNSIEKALASCLESGKPPKAPEVIELAEQLRLHIDRWFYPCSPEMHVNLGNMYVSDSRFAEHYEKITTGLSQYVRDAILANAKKIKK
ncbi:MAG: MerR family transcriptional regulator [Candidatus Riflebacteria bacterium]|nr:MerR family transcriptional regulator [Candidatus Riflebacteria bacterium]